MSRLRFALATALPVVIAACQTSATPDPVRRDTRAELAAGKLIYDTHCARCHGLDGKDDTYPFIATLDGIGKRYTIEQILEETWATGFVARQRFSPEEELALAKYVAGL